MKKLLIVDDSMTSRMLFKAHMPKDLDYEVVDAQDADSALAQVKEHQPDLIVLDYNMPGKNGVEIAQEIQATGVQTTYVLLTANTQKFVTSAALDAGFKQVVDKPITGEKIASFLTD